METCSHAIQVQYVGRDDTMEDIPYIQRGIAELPVRTSPMDADHLLFNHESIRVGTGSMGRRQSSHTLLKTPLPGETS